MGKRQKCTKPRYRNKEKNLKKKKKEKGKKRPAHVGKEEREEGAERETENWLDLSLKVKSAKKNRCCRMYPASKIIPHAIMAAKLRRDQNLMNLDIDTICNKFQTVFSKRQQPGASSSAGSGANLQGGEGAANLQVENLAKNVKDLLIEVPERRRCDTQVSSAPPPAGCEPAAHVVAGRFYTELPSRHSLCDFNLASRQHGETRPPRGHPSVETSLVGALSDLHFSPAAGRPIVSAAVASDRPMLSQAKVNSLGQLAEKILKQVKLGDARKK